MTNSTDTSSEIIDSQSKNPQVDTSKYELPSPGILPILRILAYLSLVIAITSCITTFLFPGEIKLLIILVVSISLFIFLLPVNSELNKKYTKKLRDYNVLKARDIYINVSQLEDSPKSIQIMQGVETALSYTQELIEDYKKTRVQSRFFYYLLQIVTIIFSGVTPLLVLVDKLDTGPVWLNWLPVIFPAIASIVASLSTSFPFEDKWLSSNRAIELLEAEQEKFLLGVTTGYRIPRNAEEKERYKTTRDAMAKFINQVNTIHLKQLQEQEKTEQGAEEGVEKQVDEEQ
ncbi:MAG: DUF4231 domain-containing protein [Okeania sp. SIO3I5]|uniref:DUF4231 domain-containing protein n=1 Tax=Okeania sp. SIO3I5 TaxID=2607805 RepID=UPI0013BD7445|nr:DUF4231 domain-containing protein [Okeania sp. SIO3I5]NEQ35252.1 DUF4231 domain-containing protein [Okeania sp. SIO3I5]